jgi:hypothetical protein
MARRIRGQGQNSFACYRADVNRHAGAIIASIQTKGDGMRLTLFAALAFALFGSVLPGCERTATDAEEAASKGETSGAAPYGGAAGQAGEESKRR